MTIIGSGTSPTSRAYRLLRSMIQSDDFLEAVDVWVTLNPHHIVVFMMSEIVLGAQQNSFGDLQKKLKRHSGEKKLTKDQILEFLIKLRLLLRECSLSLNFSTIGRIDESKAKKLIGQHLLDVGIKNE